jgi:hypothetical protein
MVVTYTSPNDPQKKPFFTTYYEQELILRLPKYVEALQSLGTPPPVWIFVTLVGVKGVRIDFQHAVSLT